MCGIFLTILLALVAQAYTKHCIDKLVDRCVDKFLTWALKMPSVHYANLDLTTLGKFGHLAISSCATPMYNRLRTLSSPVPSFQLSVSRPQRGCGLFYAARREAVQSPPTTAPQLMDARAVAASLWKDEYLYNTTIHALVKCGPKGPPAFRLAYMPMRNRGEILRLILEEAQVPYEIEVIGFVPWKECVKSSTPQGKCPVLRNYDGKGNDLGQEGAITRFLAESLGLAGRTLEERTVIDSLYCLWFSTLRNNGVSHDGEHFSIASLKDSPPLTAAERAKYQEVFRINSLSKRQRSLMALGFFEKQLEETNSGFLATKDKPSYVDLGLLYILFELAESDNVPDFAERFELPRLGAFLESMQKRKGINEYLQSPCRMPRYARQSNGTSLYTYVEGKGSPRIHT